MPVVTPMEFLTIEDKIIIIIIIIPTTTDYVYEVSSQVQILLQLL